MALKDNSKNRQPFGRLKECRYLSDLLESRKSDISKGRIKLEKYFFEDVLTGLPNRTKLINDISLNDSPALFLINIDQFNQINSLFGIENGDSVLLLLAEKLSGYMRDYPLKIYKLQADEYALLMNIRGEKIPWGRIGRIAKRLVSDIEKSRISVMVSGAGDEYEISLNITIGIAVAKVVGKDNLLTAADMALKTAKTRKMPFLFYKESRETKKLYRENIHWARVIKDAIKDDRIVPYFQPIFNISTKKVEKYEALARLIDEDNTIVLPHQFSELSKAIRMYPFIARIMIRKSLKMIRTNPVELSFNLSAGDIMDHRLKRLISSSIKRMGIGHKITFEILESEEIENYRDIALFIDSFKKMGCKIGLDDFGTGYSNFSHLIKLQVDFIKIDASLIRNIDKDKSSRLIVKSIVNFSREMAIKTVAEYVHSRSVYNTVCRLGIDYAQGYFIGEPSPLI